jgi:hypothetical protein
MTCHITMQRIPPPPPLPSELNRAQTAFLALHLGRVDTWQWHFLGTQLRAQADGISATIWRDDLDHLIRRGLLRRSHGEMVEITAQGRQAVE